MTLKQRISWLTIFTVLALFTLYSVSSMLQVNKAYADTIKSNSMQNNSNTYVVINDNGKDKICAVTPEQEKKLAVEYSVTLSQMKVGSSESMVATVTGDKLTEAQLKVYLKSINGGVNCHIVTRGHIFFLPVIPGVS